MLEWPDSDIQVCWEHRGRMNKEQDGSSAPDQRPPGGRDRLLVVEDEEVVREVLVRFLDLGGYEVDQAASAEEGLRHLSQRSYNLLLIDLRLPGMSGLQFLEAARRLDPSCGTLILTGYGTLESAMAAMALGAHGFLPKPVSSAQLLETVAKTLDRVKAVRKQQRLLALRAVQSVASILLGEPHPQQVAERLLDIMLEELSASRGLVFLQEGAEVRVATSRSRRVGTGDSSPPPQALGALLQGALGQWEGPMLLSEESHRPELYTGLRALRLGSALGVPLKGPAGPFGFLVLARGQEDAPLTPDDMDLAVALVEVGALALHAALQGQELQRAEGREAASQGQEHDAQELRHLLQSKTEELQAVTQRLELTWQTFGEVVDLRSGWRRGRAARGVALVQALADASGLPPGVLVEAALLHDVGLARSPQPQASPPLPTAEEEERQHPVDGAALLRQMGSPQEVILAALHHHESYDGSGYPDGLAGNAIPLLARLIRVVDSYLDLAYGAPGRPPVPWQDALARTREGAGSLFDPALVERLARRLEAKGEGPPLRQAPG